MVPEEVPITPGPGGMQLNAQRHADSALMSWRAGKIGSGSLTSGLSLSARSSDIDLREFLAQRGRILFSIIVIEVNKSLISTGNHPLEGLYKAAAQGDRARIMHIMRVSDYY